MTPLEIIQFLSQGGMIAVGSLSVFIGYKYLNKKLFLPKRKPPREHGFYDKIDFFINIKIPGIRIKYMNKDNKYTVCEGRTWLFRKMLITKFKAWEECMKGLLNDKPNINTLNKIHNTHLKTCVDKWQNEWKEAGIPQIVFDEFNKHHDIRTEILIKECEYICTKSQVTEDIDNALSDILDFHKAFLIETIHHTERTLCTLNGILTSLGEIEGNKFN